MEGLVVKLSKSVKATDDLAGAVESIALAVVSRAASWTAAIPNAVMVARATQEIFALSPGLSGVVAASLELVGQGVSNLWLRGVEWNRDKRKSDPAANTWLSFGLMAGYFALDVGIIVSLAVPRWLETGDIRQLVAVFYPVCGIISTIALNERAAQFRREMDVDRERQDRKQRRQQGRQPIVTQPDNADDSYVPITETTKERARVILSECPDISGSELGVKLGKSKSLGRLLKREIVSELSPAVSGHRGNGSGPA